MLISLRPGRGVIPRPVKPQVEVAAPAKPIVCMAAKRLRDSLIDKGLIRPSK
jgi:hypothetical protein